MKNRFLSLPFIKNAIHVVCLLLLMIPIVEMYMPIDPSDYNSEFGWQKQYLLCSLEMLVVYAPFYIVWFLIQIVKSKRKQYNLIQIGLLLTLFYFFNAIAMLSFPMQDLVPYWGLVLVPFLFPLLLIYHKLQKPFLKKEVI